MAANGSIPVESIILLNNWPDGSVPNLFQSAPNNGFTGSDHHNVAAAAYQLGTTARVYNDGTVGTSVAGWSTLMYGKNSTTAIAAALELCQPASATSLFTVSSTLTDAIITNDISPLVAVSISAMTASYYGWFWVGGVAPSSWVTATATGDLPTDATVAIGLACVGAYQGTKGVVEGLTSGTLDAPCIYTLVAASGGS